MNEKPNKSDIIPDHVEHDELGETHLEHDSMPELQSGPSVGTYAFTARIMAGLYPDFDWDSWKDEMKDQD